MVSEMEKIKLKISEVKNFTPISRNPTDISVVLVDDKNQVVDDGFYLMRGSRFFKSFYRHYNDRRRKGEYWYCVANKAGARFARAFSYRGCKHFFVTTKFFDRMTEDVCLYTGSAKKTLEAEFKNGFFEELFKINPILKSRKINDTLDIEICISICPEINSSILIWVSTHDQNVKEIAVLDSLLEQTNYIIDAMRKANAEA